MSIGYKIKALRKKQGITQNELANDVVSRSMLSRIESGSAEPSISSLKAIAKRLGIPAGFLLDDSEDLLPAERALYTKLLFEKLSVNDFEACLDIFEKSDLKEKKEFVSVFAYCTFSVACDSFYHGNFTRAKYLFSKTSAILPKVGVFLPSVSNDRISLINSVIDNIASLEDYMSFSPKSPDFYFKPSLFFFLLRLLDEQRISDCNAFLEFCELDSHYSSYIKAQILIKDYKFIDALLMLKTISHGAQTPVFIKLMCYSSIENCCKLCEDYKGAYENRLLYTSLLEKIK